MMRRFKSWRFERVNGRTLAPKALIVQIRSYAQENVNIFWIDLPRHKTSIDS
jgi:hypothetical protein